MRWILVDRILEIDAGKSAVGVRSFSRSEIFFMDHFPGFPIVPGVLHVEMIAQLGARCVIAAVPDIVTVLGSIKSSKFYHRIVPGDQAVIRVKVAVRKAFSVVNGHIEVNGKKVSAAEVILVHIPIPDNLGRGARDEVMDDWLKEGAREPGPLE